MPFSSDNILLDDSITGNTANFNFINLSGTNISNIFYSITNPNPDTFVTGGTYSNGTLTLNRQNGSVSVSGFSTGGTNNVDTFVTGFTYSNNVFTILQNQGRPNLTITTPSFITAFTNTFVTGVTYANSVLTLSQNQGQSDLTAIIDTTLMTGSTDVFVTGFTYNNANLLSIGRNQSRPSLNVTINTFTGLTVNGNITASVFSGGSFVGNASGMTGVGGSASQFSLTSTTTTSTSVDSLLSGMSGRTISGQYLIMFSGLFSTSNGAATTTLTLFVNGVRIPTSVRANKFGGNTNETTIIERVTSGADSLIEIRWNTSAGTATATNRTLIIL
jgi:hypothetical protein